MTERQHTAPAASLPRKLKWSRVMCWIRRVHLYSGMLMFPWVMLYGITATLFNHPGCLSDMSREHTAIADEHLAAIPEPRALAERLLEELASTRAIEEAGAPRGAHYAGSLSLRHESETRDRFLLVDVASGSARITTRPREPVPPPAPFAQNKWFPAGEPIEAARQGIEAELLDRGVGDGELSVRSAPKLRFRAAIDGVDWNLEYALDTGTLTGTDGPRPPASLRTFALRLHMMHGFPSELGPRWLWALLVDSMFLTMVFWGTSGVLMCVQMKRVRRNGLIALALGVAIALYLVLGMFALMR